MYRVEYLRNEPFAVRRLSDGFLIPLSKDGFALDEWAEFQAWNEKQTPPLDYTSAQAEKTKEVFALPIETPALYADDIFVSSRTIKDDPDEAFAEALAEASKAKGQAKSLDLIARSSAKMLEKLRAQVKELEKRVKKLEK